MTWGHALPAVGQDATASASLDFFPHKHHEDTCGPVPSTGTPQKSAAQGPLILSALMHREALAKDHKRALRRRDMQGLHRIEAKLKNVTTQILRKGR